MCWTIVNSNHSLTHLTQVLASSTCIFTIIIWGFSEYMILSVMLPGVIWNNYCWNISYYACGYLLGNLWLILLLFQMAKSLHLELIEASARTNHNIDQVFQRIADKIFQNRKQVTLFNCYVYAPTIWKKIWHKNCWNYKGYYMSCHLI